MSDEASQTLLLLQAWHRGDRSALETLLERDLPWIREYVASRLGQRLRSRADAEDYVQDAVLQALQYAPRFLVSSRGQFRKLIARIAENVIRDAGAGLRAGKRDVARERVLASDTLLYLDPPAASVTRPSQAANRNDEQAWLQLGLELLPEQDRAVVRMREWQQMSFADIGRALEINEDAARMRFNRGLKRLAETVVSLQTGGLPALLGE